MASDAFETTITLVNNLILNMLEAIVTFSQKSQEKKLFYHSDVITCPCSILVLSYLQHYFSNIRCDFLDLPIILWRQFVHQNIIFERYRCSTTKQVANICNKVKNIMPTYMEIGILFVHIESLTITAFGIKVNRLGKLRVQMPFEILADSLNKRFSVISQLFTFALVGQASGKHAQIEVWLVVLEAIKQEQQWLIQCL